MTDTKNTSETKETTIVTVSHETNALVEKEMTGESDQLKQETKALVEAIKKRAQSEINNAQTLNAGCLPKKPSAVLGRRLKRTNCLTPNRSNIQ